MERVSRSMNLLDGPAVAQLRHSLIYGFDGTVRIPAILTLIVLTSCVSAPARVNQTASESTACPHTRFIDGPYVADEATARAIALAIIEQRQSPERQAEYDLNVADMGDSWTVFQSVRGYPRREGDEVIVIGGGGGLAMQIAKCDGAISSMHGQR